MARHDPYMHEEASREEISKALLFPEASSSLW